MTRMRSIAAENVQSSFDLDVAATDHKTTFLKLKTPIQRDITTLGSQFAETMPSVTFCSKVIINNIPCVPPQLHECLFYSRREIQDFREAEQARRQRIMKTVAIKKKAMSLRDMAPRQPCRTPERRRHTISSSHTLACLASPGPAF